MFEVKEKASKLVRQKGWKDASLNEARMKELATDVELSFEDVLLMTKHLMPGQHVPLMNVYATSVKKLQHVRDAFEYATSYVQIDILDELIITHKEDDLLAEWILVYQLVLDFFRKKIGVEQMFERARTLFAYVKNPLVRIRLEFIEFNTLYQLQTISSSKLLERRSRTLFAQLQPSFMKTVLGSRLSLLLGCIKLYHEVDLESAERHFLAVIVNETTPDLFLCSAHHSLGTLMAINENPLCLQHGERAIKYAKRAKAYDYQRMLETEYVPFMRNCMKEIFEVSGVREEEQVHQYIVRGEQSRAKALINHLEAKGDASPFLVYYRGLTLNSIPLLFDSMEAFRESNAHMTKLVRRKIEQLL
ncbi:AimR family lysis-lysogeny pheromone receptor [Bacillus sp. JCM 19041]|uniref:AimR family lysis-lysogeny pheromone receptor n=1 Tax=Bacillus sp. JCM 19041 TaxID=1460637 RepID=UPI0006CF6E61